MDELSLSQTLEQVCCLILEGKSDFAKKELRTTTASRLKRVERKSRSLTHSLSVFSRDGFVDRYSGKRLVFPGVLLLLSRLYPQEFPYHRNWKMDSTHFAYWELSPTLDHIIPLARGGQDIGSNLVTTSMLRNQAKANWTLEELGWKLLPPGDLGDWDGLMNRFIEIVRANTNVLKDPKIRKWHAAATSLESRDMYDA